MPYKDPEKKREYDRQYRQRNLDKKRVDSAKQRRMHPDYYRAYYEAHKEEYRASAARYRERNREKIRERMRNRYRNSPEVQRRQYFQKSLRNLGVTEEQYLAAYEAQGGRCAICQTHESELTRRLSVDHDHATGKFRSLLCGPCNRALGLLYENEVRAIGLLSYIRSHAA